MENLTKLNDDTYKYAIEMINKKDFDDYTTKRVWDYIESHDILYGDIIDTKDVIDRIGENLSKNIVIEQKYSSIIEKGGFSPVHREIVVHTKDFGDDEYFHELDHVATSNLSTMPDYDAEDAWDMEKMNERYNNGYEFFRYRKAWTGACWT